MSQDSKREEAVIRFFGLEEYSFTNRSNQYEPDAKMVVDEKAITLELKSKPEKHTVKGKEVKKTDVSTARGFDLGKAKEWKEKTDVFIFSEYEGSIFNGFFNAHYALTYEQLHPIIKEKVIEPYLFGRPRRKNSKGYIGIKEYNAKIVPLLEGAVDEDTLIRLKHNVERGGALNDPKFPWKYIKNNGTLVKNRKELVAFIRTNIGDK
jgi:hypothetical protein